MRKDFRLFKLERMDGIVHGDCFERRDKIPLPELSNEKIFPARGRVKACRDKVTVIEPESVKDKLYQIACDMIRKYERKD